MAARKSAARKPAKRGPPSPAVRMNALFDTLSGISRLFGGSTVEYEESEIRVKIPGFSTQTYTMEGNDLIVTTDYGTPKRPDIVTERTYIESPIAFLLEHTSPNDNFKDVYMNIEEFAERELRR